MSLQIGNRVGDSSRSNSLLSRQKAYSGSTSIAQANFWYRDRLKMRSRGTSFLLHLRGRRVTAGVGDFPTGPLQGCGTSAAPQGFKEAVPSGAKSPGAPLPFPHHATVIRGSR